MFPASASPTRSPRAKRIFGLLLAFLAIVSCGSRTGLFGPSVDNVEPSGGGDASAQIDGRVPCVPGRFDFELALTQLMFVVDRSRSMEFSLDGRDNVPRSDQRWTILQDALRQTLPTFDQEIAMGAKFFPDVRNPESQQATELCRTESGVGIAPARGNANRIVAQFDTADPVGGTPTSEAVRLAAQFLSQSRSVARTIVLATDGAPNCNEDLNVDSCVCTLAASSPVTCSDQPNTGRYNCLDDNRTISTIRTIAQDQKIPVYVIGIGSTERPEFLRVLDAMAVAGGRPKPTAPRHYNVQSAEELTSALGTIRDSVARCTYLTPSAPVDPNLITVEINGQQIARDPTKANGWDWIDQAFGWLGFFGDACEAAQVATPRASGVSGVVSCPTP